MPSPLAHVGLAWCAGLALAPPGPAPGGRRALARRAAALAVVAVAPDFDIGVDLLFPGAHAHHGPTHSVVFAVGLGLLAGRLMGVDRAALLVAALLHAPLDWSTGDPGAPADRYGVMALWPFTPTRYIDADPFFRPYYIDREGGLWNMLHPTAVAAYAREATVVTAAAALALSARRIRSRGP